MANEDELPPLNSTIIENNSNASTFQPNHEIHKISIKPVTFIKTQPRLYFMQMEAQFNLARITGDTTRFNHILGMLDPTYLQCVLDVIENPPSENKYDTIKSRIISEFTQSDQHKLRVLLNETELGDAKPSQLLRKMRELSNNALNDDALKTLWIERLPEQIRPVISIADGDLNKIAAMADKMLEITTFKQINEIHAPSQSTSYHSSDVSHQISSLTHQIEELTKKFSQFSSNRGRSQNRDKTHNSNSNKNGNRQRSSSRSHPNDSPYCFYHYKFGALARKCVEPCKYKPPNTEPKN